MSSWDVTDSERWLVCSAPALRGSGQLLELPWEQQDREMSWNQIRHQDLPNGSSK